MATPNRRPVPVTGAHALYDTQTRQHVYMDLCTVVAESDAHDFLRRHGLALESLLLNPLDVDDFETELDRYRKDVTTLEDALGAARETLTDVAVRLRRLADRLTNEDGSYQPVFGDSIDDLITLSEDLDKAYEAADNITLETEW
jgi:hypothetical protein